MQECLKGWTCKGQSVCPVGSRHEVPRQALAHSIIAEHLEGTAGLKYTLPVFLSETCHSCRAAFPLTAEDICEQLGIGLHSPVGSFLAAHAPAQTHDATRGGQRSAAIMLCMTCASNLPHSNACTSQMRSRHHARQVMLETLGSRKGSCAGEKATLLPSLLEAVQANHGGASHPVAYQHLQVVSPQKSALPCLACKHACCHTMAQDIKWAAKPGQPVISR